MRSLVNPGENVGTIAGQSIGEPSTQMTLNTFHLAGHGGANVTLGIPRLREILMTASDNIKTPMMTLPVIPGVDSKDVNAFSNRFQKLEMNEIVKGISIDQDIVNVDGSCMRDIRIKITFEDLKKANEAFDLSFEQLSHIFNSRFLPLLMSNIIRQTKQSSVSVVKVVEQKPEEEEKENDEDQDEEMQDQDPKSKVNRKFVSQQEEEDDEPRTDSKMGRFKPYYQGSRIQDQSNDGPATGELVIRLPITFKKVLALNMVETVIKKVLLMSVKNIEKSFVVERKGKNGKETVVQTQGINFAECYKFGHIIDVNRIETNDIYQMLRHYGVEAARQTIIQEIRNVFGVYGINVDYRHLSLIADHMTQNGDYKAFNRIGMQDSSSPFMKMSFETTAQFLTSACLHHEFDDNSTPSSSIVIGRVPKIGTGYFGLVDSKNYKS